MKCCIYTIVLLMTLLAVTMAVENTQPEAGTAKIKESEINRDKRGVYVNSPIAYTSYTSPYAYGAYNLPYAYNYPYSSPYYRFSYRAPYYYGSYI